MDQESLTHWRGRMVHRAAVWYYEHLGGQKPIVIVTEDEQLLTQYQNSRFEVFVLKLGDYLSSFWPNLTAARNLYESLRASHTLLLEANSGAVEGQLLAAKKETGFEDHWRPEAVEAGLKSGKLMQGTLFVNKYHAQSEATVMAR